MTLSGPNGITTPEKKTVQAEDDRTSAIQLTAAGGDALVGPDHSSVALGAMSVPQLTAAYRSLDQCQARYDKLSGIVATMKGLVLTEVKAKLAHGKFLPWLAENFPKSRVIAAQDMRLAAELCKSKPTFTFDALGRDLASTLLEIESAQLDLAHPLVREVAEFVDGRTRYQLLLDFPASLGGHHPRQAPPLTPEEERETFLQNCKTDFESAFTALDDLVFKSKWKAPSISDAHLDAAADLCRQFARDAAAWLKTPERQRAALPLPEST